MTHNETTYDPTMSFWLAECAPLAAPLEQELSPEEQVSLLDLLDKVLTKGVVVSGDITLSVAGVDLLFISLRLMITTAEKALAVGAVRSVNGRLV